MPITEYKNLAGGLNLTDSPLAMADNQATGQSFNYDYSRTGAISKVLGHQRLNSSADAQLKTLGLHLHHSVSTDARTVVRCAGTKIQTFNPDTGAFSNQSEDTTVANSDFLSSSSTQPVVGVGFNTSGGTQVWMAGGGMSAIYGYTGSNVTQNGTPAPTGTLGATLGSASTGGTWSATGTRYWAVAFRKRGTQSVSNAALDVSVNIDDTTKRVVISFASITVDTTKYDKILLYRSAVSGASAFTAGDLVATLDSSTTSYNDTGSSEVSSTTVPRAGNTTDNSVLATGTYKYLTAFKRRLVTCLNSTIYLSDLNKPESWPSTNTITVPSGGPITGLAVIGYNSPFTTGADEYLVIFKENETWVLTGSTISDWELKFVDTVGCIGQSYVVSLNGFISWWDYRGIYLWDGHGKPVYASRPIEALFSSDGDLDKSKLSYGWGRYSQKDNQVVWRVSHRTEGEQKLTVKMDTRLTVPKISNQMDERVIEGVFIIDTDPTQMYAGLSYRPGNYQEMFIVGDNAGYVLRLNNSVNNPGGTGIEFSYETRPLDMGKPEQMKRFKRVIVILERLTDNDLTMYFWADNRQRPDEASEVAVNTAPIRASTAALWDIAFWDQAFWDDYVPDLSFVEFNLHSNENNAEGTSLKLKFEQLEASAPVRIHAFYVDWEDANPLPIPTQQAS